MASNTLKAKLKPLHTFERLPRNPKDHDIGGIAGSYSEFGFLERVVINERTGHILSGHGRIDTLQMQKANGASPPSNVVVDISEDGSSSSTWLVPVDYCDVPEDREEAAAIALNRYVERGGWNEEQLAQVLSDLAAKDQLHATGYDQDDVDDLLALIAPPDLDQLEKEHGVATDEEFWPVIKIKVPYSLEQRFYGIMEAAVGEREHEKLESILDALAWDAS
jgi:hypothetical protein